VWWDPHLFEGRTPTKPGLRRHWILQAEPGGGVGGGASAHKEWQERLDGLTTSGSAPSLSVTTVTRLSEDEVEDPDAAATAASVAVEEVAGRDLQRPSGKRFGALVHEMLARVSLSLPASASSGAIESLAEAIARLLDATADETRAAIECVSNALAHPRLMEARDAEECFRETPVIFQDANGRLVEGVPDLVYRRLQADTHTGETSAVWTVLDFKTDLRVDLAEDAYRRQVGLYMRAIARTRAIAESVRGVLLYV
jgi:ATP-dependent exoDNAse (exonuclease V) beta subunit